jgi:hypothetical protein
LLLFFKEEGLPSLGQTPTASRGNGWLDPDGRHLVRDCAGHVRAARAQAEIDVCEAWFSGLFDDVFGLLRAARIACPA